MVTEFSLVLILLCVVVLPVAAVAFARSGKAYDEIGKGRFAVDFDESGGAEHHEEIRQLVEAKAYRQARRGEEPVDVEAEVERLLNGEPEPAGERDAPPTPAAEPSGGAADVLAKNESRERRGEEPLDVEAEVDRILAEFG